MGTALQSYQAPKFQQLDDFFIAKHELDNGRRHLPILGQIIVNHGIHEHVGISLLHKHYDIATNERLVKRFFPDKALIRPHLDQGGGGLLPYVWQSVVDASSAGYRWYPLEFMEDVPAASKARAHLSALTETPDFLAELATAMAELRLSKLFGVATLHNDGIMDVEAHETLLETTDVETRTLTIQRVDRKVLEEEKTEVTETLWVFSPLTAEGEEGGACKGHNPCKHCLGHCQGHCKNHCAKHCVNHCKNHPPPTAG